VYKEWSERFRALGDGTRLHILGLLSVRDACVCELVELLPVSQPAVSQHLRKLKQVGFVREYRQKSWVFYALRTDLPPVIAAFLRDLPVAESDVSWLSTHQVAISCAAMEEGSSTDSSSLLTKSLT